MPVVMCPGCESRLRTPETSSSIEFDCPRCGQRIRFRKDSRADRQHLSSKDSGSTTPPSVESATGRSVSRRRTSSAGRESGRRSSRRSEGSADRRNSGRMRQQHGADLPTSDSTGVRIVVALLVVSVVGIVAAGAVVKMLFFPGEDSVAGPRAPAARAEASESDSSVATAELSVPLSGVRHDADIRSSAPGSGAVPVADPGDRRRAPGAVADVSRRTPSVSGAGSPEAGSISMRAVQSPPGSLPAQAVATAEEPRPRWDQEPTIDRAGGDKSSVQRDRWADGIIPYGRGDALAAGPPGSPVVVSGGHVWHKVQQRIIAELDGELDGRTTTAISPDGQLFGAAMKTPNQQNTAVRVWDTETGEQKFIAAGEAERFSDTILLTNDRLYVGGRLGDELRVWDCRTGERLKSLRVNNAKFDAGSSAVSRDGDYLAVTAGDRLVVVRTSDGRQAAVMQNPAKMPDERRGEPLIIRDNLILADRSESSEATSVYAWMQSLEFSPGMEELAGVSTHPSPRIMCWNNRGALVFDRPLYTQRRAFWENRLQWFPDRSAWLVEHEIVHRETGRVVLSVRGRSATHLQMYVYDNDHLMGTFPDSPDELHVREIPWAAIRRSLAAMADGSNAILGPGSPVRVELKLGAVPGGQNDTAALIQTALERRLARDQIALAPDGGAVFRLKFAETAGDTLPIYHRQSAFDFRGRDSGRQMTEAIGTLTIELLVPGQETPIWRDTLHAISSRTFSKEITEAAVRESMLSSLQSELHDLDIPYFIPKSDQLPALPIVIN